MGFFKFNKKYMKAERFGKITGRIRYLLAVVRLHTLGLLISFVLNINQYIKFLRLVKYVNKLFPIKGPM